MSFLANSLNNVPFSRVNTVIFESNGTYTPPTNLRYAIITIVGGGGGSGGRAAAISPTRSLGASGGGGGTLIGTFTRSNLSPNVSITIGGGGAGGTAGANPGSPGGNTILGTSPSVSAGGGGGGAAAGPAVQIGATAGGAPGAATTSGSVLGFPGQAGNAAFSGAVTGLRLVQFPSGGNSALGMGGAWFQAGTDYGGGGGTCNNDSSQPAGAGFAGAPGVIIIQEFLAEPV